MSEQFKKIQLKDELFEEFVNWTFQEWEDNLEQKLSKSDFCEHRSELIDCHEALDDFWKFLKHKGMLKYG